MNRIQEIEELKRYHSKLDYNNEQERSDDEYDELIEELKELDS